MHSDEVAISTALVAELVASQFPHWAALPLRRVSSAGTDNAVFRLGDFLAVRLPRIPSADGQVVREQRWLPILAPQLPLQIPTLVAVGAPGEGYPWAFGIYSWISGDTAVPDRIDDPLRAAATLGEFVARLRSIPVANDAPLAGRGVGLAVRDERVHRGIAALAGLFNPDAMLNVWTDARAHPPWTDPPVWVHGDLNSGNILASAGRLSAVIDFGGIGCGDPAGDALAAWAYCDAGNRQAFRDAAGFDDATWARSRGTALDFAVTALPYYRRSNPGLAAVAYRTITQLLADRS